MSITLDAITLPSDLIWTDQYTWSPVVQSVTHALTGAQVIQEGKKLAGREITLVGDDESAWILKSVLDSLLAKANTADLAMILDYHGATYNVMFRRDAAPIEAQQIGDYSNPQNDDYYSLIVRLMEV